MSKTLIAVVVIVLVGIGGYFMFKNKGADAPTVSTEQSSTEENTDTSGKKMAFSEFVKQGGSYKCEVKQAMSDFDNSGTVYISGSNMRGEFSTIAEGRTMDTTFIMRDGYSYMWSSSLPNMGFKTKIVASGTTSADTSGTYSWNADQIGDYNCEVWTADASKFTIPTSITFKETSAK